MTTNHRHAPLAQSLDIRPLAGHIGAEILGVDLREPLDPRPSLRSARRCCSGRSSSSATSSSPRSSTSRSGASSASRRRRTPRCRAPSPTIPKSCCWTTRLSARREGRRQRRQQSLGGAEHREPLAHRCHVRAEPADGLDPARRRRAALRRRHAVDEPRRRLRALSAPLQRLCDELHAVHHNYLPIVARRAVRRAEKAVPVAGHALGAPGRPGASGDRARRRLFVNPNFTSHIVELSRAEGATCWRCCTSTCPTRRTPAASAGSRAASRSGTTGRPATWCRPTSRPARTARCSASRSPVDLPVGPDGTTSHSLTEDA